MTPADYLAAFEASALGQTARSSSWFYPLSNLLHVFGGALLVGAIAVFDMLLLRRRYEAAAQVAGMALPIAMIGAALLLASGPVLLATEATAFGRNPVFLTKMTLISVALFNIAAYYGGAWRENVGAGFPRHARLHAAISLGVWSLVLLAGRLIAYV
jgi:uncharacterized membrane protein